MIRYGSGRRAAGPVMLLGTLILGAPATAQTGTQSAQSAAPSASRFELTIPSIMRGPELVGEGPSNVQWSDDGQWVYFRWKRGGEPWHAPVSVYRVAASGGEPQRLSDTAVDSLGVFLASGDVSADGRQRVVSHQGDLYIVDLRAGTTRRLTDTRATASSPVFSRDSRTVYFISDNNLFAHSLADGALRQITDIRSGPAPSEPRPPQGQRAFLVEQQRELFEHIRIQAQRREEQQARQRARQQREPRQAIFLNAQERVSSLTIEPGGRYAVISTASTAPSSARRVQIPFWVTDSGYVEPQDYRANVGDSQDDAGRMGIVSLVDGDVRWLDVAAATSPAGVAAGFGGTRFVGWNDAGTVGLIAAGSADFKNAWLWTMDAATGQMTQLVADRDSAWMQNPCPFWTSNRCVGWLPDGRVWFVSERSGYTHLYTIAADGSGLRQLTGGDWEVHNVTFSPRRDRFYLATNEGSPHHHHFWSMNPDGSNRTRITTMPGRQEVTVSPDESTLAFVHSYANRPPELYIAPNRAGAQARQVTTSYTPEWASYNWIVPEIVHVTARDGARVPARIYRPQDVGAQPNGAAVIFVHGAGYLQNVHSWWSQYYREYMFHHLLAERGYVVLDMDFRASSGYGRDWRTAIYRHMGGWDLSDHVDGSRWLQQNYNIDPKRIGIYGGSYGGFITLMALFNESQDFGAGAALRAVTDWAHYNHNYTGRILNLPQDDSVAYRRSSPIYFAEGLQDPLLITHGMVDVNVHFSDVVRLAQRLIELGKTDWEMALYPVEDHAFVEPSSWADQYRRIFELFERHIGSGRRAIGQQQ
jgi:dipeptidyl aminopeptidase/acylaminoacyl peptidase